MAQEEFGHLLLLSIMDVTDDTVLVTKGLLNVCTRFICHFTHFKITSKGNMLSLLNFFFPKLQEILKAGDEAFLALVNHKIAKSIFLHVLAPRDPKYFSPDVLKILAPVTVIDPATGEAQPTR